MTVLACPNFGGVAIGVTLMVMIYAGGHISGANFNPTVTASLMFTGKIEVITGQCKAEQT